MRRIEAFLLCAAVGVPTAGWAEEAATSLHLDDLVAEAVRNHPAGRRARRTAEAAAEVGSRVGSMPDPVLGVQAQNIRVDQPALTSSPMSAIQVGLTEMVPFPGKLARRQGVAEGKAMALGRDAETTESEVALDVRSAYWRLHFAEQALLITVKSERLMNDLARAAIARLSVGKAPQQDALQAQASHSRLRAMLLERRQAVTSAQRQLNGAVGRPPEAGLLPTEAPSATPLDRVEVLRQAGERSPSIQASRARAEAARRAVAEAEYERWPDLQVGLGYRFRAVVPGDPSQGADMFGASVGVSLPIFMATKQNASVRQAHKELEAAQAGLEAAELQVTTRLHRLLDAISRLDEEIVLYEHELIPEANKALDASIEDYQVGGVGFVSLLQTWQAELDARLAREGFLAERAERAAEVRALVEKEASP